MKTRSESEIIALMLETAMTGATKWTLARQSQLTYEQTGRYLDLLKEQKLIAEPKRRFYKITESGISFFRKTNELNDLITPIKPLIRNR